MKKLPTLVLLGAALVMSSSTHASWVSVTPTSSPLSLAGANGPITVTYGVTPVAQSAATIFFSNTQNADTPNQTLAGIETVVEGLFFNNVTGIAADQVDNAGGGSSASFTNTQTYNYLAVHAGQHEFVFGFASDILAGSTFSITTSGQAAGISNFRSYYDPNSSGIPGVPVPAAVWLFGSGLVGLIGFGRRKPQIAA